MAKPIDRPYESDKRSQTKVKHHRSVDCVVAGYAEHRNGGVGSLKPGSTSRPAQPLGAAPRGCGQLVRGLDETDPRG
ncbi:MAG: hypothetical protein R2716_08305 [Microthrixaceae bacterium]